MTLRSDWSTDKCAIARGADVFADPWTLLVLREVLIGNSRFDGIRAALDVAENTLSSRLSSMVEAGLLRREQYAGDTRPRFEYLLTEAGSDALPVLHALAGWATKHTESPSGVEMRVICTRCGTRSLSSTWCEHCSADLTTATTAWERPSMGGLREVLVDSRPSA